MSYKIDNKLYIDPYPYSGDTSHILNKILDEANKTLITFFQIYPEFIFINAEVININIDSESGYDTDDSDFPDLTTKWGYQLITYLSATLHNGHIITAQTKWTTTGCSCYDFDSFDKYPSCTFECLPSIIKKNNMWYINENNNVDFNIDYRRFDPENIEIDSKNKNKHIEKHRKIQQRKDDLINKLVETEGYAELLLTSELLNSKSIQQTNQNQFCTIL